MLLFDDDGVLPVFFCDNNDIQYCHWWSDDIRWYSILYIVGGTGWYGRLHRCIIMLSGRYCRYCRNDDAWPVMIFDDDDDLIQWFSNQLHILHYSFCSRDDLHLLFLYILRAITFIWLIIHCVTYVSIRFVTFICSCCYSTFPTIYIHLLCSIYIILHCSVLFAFHSSILWYIHGDSLHYILISVHILPTLFPLRCTFVTCCLFPMMTFVVAHSRLGYSFIVDVVSPTFIRYRSVFVAYRYDVTVTSDVSLPLLGICFAFCCQPRLRATLILRHSGIDCPFWLFQ